MHISNIRAAHAETAKAVAVQNEALERIEAASEKRMDRMEQTLRDWQIRTDGR